MSKKLILLILITSPRISYIKFLSLSLSPFVTFISMLSYEYMFVNVIYCATDLSTLAKVL